ncbi:cold-shock protein [Pseudomonas aeruginosa VRFPA01]|nr:cold-shock protein [Pseudomonas aeruginosa VRFPA01]
MEKPGMISRWYDDKGFGFIQPKAGGEEIFLHISAFRGDRRPLQGDQVWFLASQDARGRLLLLCVLPAAGAWRMHLDGQALWPLLAYPLASLLAFALYWQDKRRAARGDWRTPEARLHLFELLGGWPGALIAQQVFRHKTRKISFQLLFWGIVLLHQLFWLDTLLGGWLSATLLQRLG